MNNIHKENRKINTLLFFGFLVGLMPLGLQAGWITSCITDAPIGLKCMAWYQADGVPSIEWGTCQVPTDGGDYWFVGKDDQGVETSDTEQLKNIDVTSAFNRHNAAGQPHTNRTCRTDPIATDIAQSHGDR